MILYHGSYLAIQTPDLVHSRKMLILDVAFTQHLFMIRQ